ncbi:MAG TPA: CoA pyrophosphatase [Rectinemataceae bacterium]|nr:CoA pyrophosphatase [Rectinemataceae bacterium]
MIAALRRAFAEIAAGSGRGLPGREAQYSMAPSHRPGSGQPGNYREAAVLVLLYPSAGRLLFPLTLRSEGTRSHRGQVSLPGGAREENETLVETAFRETHEEIGVGAGGIHLLGALSPLDVPPSGFHVQPYVACLDAPPRFVVERGEVAQLIEAPLSALLEPDAAREERRVLVGQDSRVPYYLFGGHKVWGATAMILAELRELALRSLH